MGYEHQKIENIDDPESVTQAFWKALALSRGHHLTRLKAALGPTEARTTEQIVDEAIKRLEK